MIPPSLRAQLEAWRAAGDRIVFTNGVFDVLHLGHATYLAAARQLGDRLVVGVNSDDSVRRLGKGPERPIHTAADRCALLEHLSSVDATVVFSEDTPRALIEALSPDVLVKGGDYNPMEADPDSQQYMVGRESVLNRGGEVRSIPLVPGHSTTGILRRSSPSN
jgi:rfaE bifunctional protein nucleotidyltransferase chain/domain